MTTRRAFLTLPLLGLVPTPAPSWRPGWWRTMEATRELRRLYSYHYSRPNPILERALALHEELPIVSVSIVKEPTDPNCLIRRPKNV